MTRSRGTAVAGLVACLLVLLVLPAVPAAAGAPAQRTWHADQARVPEARAAGREGDGVVVAVIDSWVDGSHPDFEGRVLDGADCTSGTCRAGAAPDGCSHGTHVAGTVASSSYGVAPRARVLPVQVLEQQSDGRCSGTTAGVAAGIRYAVARGARVLNLSLGALVPGLSSSSAITAAVADAARAGAVVVFAAGNSSVPVADSYGGNAVIVAATGPDGQLALYSQRGQGVTMAAPGGDPALGSCTAERCVTSLFPGGRYALAAGTSMAAPHVSGTAALLLAQDPSRTNQQVTDRLRATARPLSGAGSGALDATAALATAPPPPVAQAPPSTAAAPPTTSAPSSPVPRQPTSPPPTREAVAPLPPGPVEAVPVPGGEVPPVAAPDVGPSPVTSAPPLDADAAADLPPGPPALAVALLLTAALATALAGLRRPR